jgi:hypothetical protein
VVENSTTDPDIKGSNPAPEENEGEKVAVT